MFYGSGLDELTGLFVVIGFDPGTKMALLLQYGGKEPKGRIASIQQQQIVGFNVSQVVDGHCPFTLAFGADKGINR